ncbi:hypothetical protein LEMA_P083840.1 [Plenodomus lingam JN3]|uniref:F-box domain-containing protein n=1 Tax=Leptosphaeria maculans (strain JN3 / isolate v23.1.3 / race Av1-4-5-6-7-8) TaxID=985895 RepID=E5A6A0_LEPMJ|nr:hypothetical protein LEMA_P083840.1 [Plenodomus lingam JN3]CBX99145.1 hypothetical protein LEMA_P083840.1 [Plenodomus lingam JN3]
MDELPDELLLIILIYVPKTPSTLARLSLVNRQVNRIATPFFYEQFSSGDAFSCNRYLETISAHPTLGRQVRRLNWRGLTNWEEDEADELFTKVIAHQPNLRQVSWNNMRSIKNLASERHDYPNRAQNDPVVEERCGIKPFREGWLGHNGFSTSTIFRNLRSARLAMRHLRLSDIVWLMRIPTLRKLWLDAVTRYESEDNVPRSLEPLISNINDLDIRLHNRKLPSTEDIVSIVTACRCLTRLSLNVRIDISTMSEADGKLQKLKMAIEMHSTTLRSLFLNLEYSPSPIDQRFLPNMEMVQILSINPRSVPWLLLNTIHKLPRTIRTIRILPDQSRLLRVLLTWPTESQLPMNTALLEKC